MEAQPGFDLRAKFRALSRALRATFDADSVGGTHGAEKGLRRESLLGQFLAARLPPQYGVARGEIVDSRGWASKQVDVVIYDALHAPFLQETEASRVFPAECVYAAIELKPMLSTSTLAEAVANINYAKSLDRSAIAEQHHGHRIHHSPRRNPPLFGAIFALDGSDIATRLAPALVDLHRELVPERWTDCVCVLDKGLLYHFLPRRQSGGDVDWTPTVLRAGAHLGWIDSREDTLLLFYLFLLFQLNAKDLFPPDLLRYARSLEHPMQVFTGLEYPRIEED